MGNFTSYTMSVAANGTATITQVYPSALNKSLAYDSTAPSPGTAPLTVLLAGRDVVTSAYQRRLQITTSGTTLTIVISDWITGTPPGIEAQFCGVVEIYDNGSGLTFGGTPIDPTLASILPLGTIAWTWTSGIDTASITFTALPVVRGILNIGIYGQGAGGTLVPIDGTINGTLQSLQPYQRMFENRVNAYITHFNNTPSAPANVAAVATQVADTLTLGATGGFAAPQILTGYTAVASGATVTFTRSPGNGTPLYAYVFDDNLVKALVAKYPAFFASSQPSPFNAIAPSGILPGPR